jgi:hypothetical protein
VEITYDKSSIIIYSDASNVEAAACTVEIDRKNFHKMWTTDEALESSTWRRFYITSVRIYDN